MAQASSPMGSRTVPGALKVGLGVLRRPRRRAQRQATEPNRLWRPRRQERGVYAASAYQSTQANRTFPTVRTLNPKSEIKMAKLRQDAGAETVWKNRSHTHSGLVRFFQTVYAQQIGADWPFLSLVLGLAG